VCSSDLPKTPKPQGYENLWQKDYYYFSLIIILKYVTITKIAQRK